MVTGEDYVFENIYEARDYSLSIEANESIEEKFKFYCHISMEVIS